MKKNSIVLAMILCLSLCLSACGKKADPILLPATEKITSIEIANGVEDVISADQAIIAAFVQKAAAATPTTKESVQDVPDALEYTRVNLVCDGEMASFFIYQEDVRWYIEQPYQGIYETDKTILEGLAHG